MPKYFERLRQPFRNDIHLNEMVSVRPEKEDTISLHVGDDWDDVREEKRFEMVNDGLKRLAKHLRTNPQLLQAKTIVAVSWLVREHPAILERMGFIVDREHTDPYGEEMVKKYMKEDHNMRLVVKEGQRFTVPMFATISREDFLQRYGS